MLSPHHFQQFALRTEELEHYHNLAISPYHWGVRTLRIDETLLLGGVFRVLELEAIMPDGLVVSHRHGEDELELDLTEHADELSQKAILVRLALPVRKIGSAAVKGDLARYESKAGLVSVDENTGESELEIPRLKPRISLVLADEAPQKYVTLPLAGVTYGNEAYRLTEYVPPQIAVAKSSPLGDLCARVAERLREKALFLAGRVNASSAMTGPMILETKIMIHGMVSALPAFEAVQGTSVAHPYQLYIGLCSLIGNLACVGLSLVPPVPVAYDHDDPMRCFQSARDYLFRIIDEGIVEAYSVVPFRVKNGVFVLRMEEEWVADRMVVGIRTRSDLADRDTVAWMDKALVGSSSVVQSLQRKRILGAPRKQVEADADIVPPRGVVLYEITPDPNFIVAGENLVIANSMDTKGELTPLGVVFYVRNA